MSVTVDLCDDADIDRVFHIVSDAFKHDEPYIDAVYPKHDTPAGHVEGRNRMLEQKHSDSSLRCVKATDTHTGKIIGIANWLCLKNKTVKDQLEGDFWSDKDEKEFAQELYAQFAVCRRRFVQSASGPIWVLDLLAVDPEHQSEGAGTKLISWGLDHADEMGADALVESTMSAAHVYENHGFRKVEEIRMEFPAKHAHRPKPHLLFMHRPAKVETLHE